MSCLIVLILVFLFLQCGSDLKKQANHPEKKEIVKDTTYTVDTLIIYYDSLSNAFDYRIKIFKHNPPEYEVDLGRLFTLEVIDKKTKQIIYDTIYKGGPYLDSTFLLESRGNTFSKPYKTQSNLYDGQYWDIVIADLNFDNIDDFAYKASEGGNGGPVYNFHLSDKTTFKYDKYLSNDVSFFPSYIKPENRTITRLVRANAYGYDSSVYQLTKKGWKILSSCYIDVTLNKYTPDCR